MKSLKISKITTSAALACGLMATLFFSGCGTQPYNYHVSLDPSLVDTSIQVDIIGIEPDQYQKWNNLSVSEYWEPNNPIRLSSEKATMTFGPGQPETQVLSKSDKIWNTWLDDKNSTFAVILADLPGVSSSSEPDPRRLILPLNSKDWGKGSPEDIKLLVSRDKIEPSPSPKYTSP